MRYDPNDYYMNIKTFDRDEVSDVFSIKDVLMDYCGVESIVRNRCKCPIHGGENNSAMQILNNNRCYSYTENQSYDVMSLINAFDGKKRNSIKYPFFILCDMYGVDPETFSGVEKRAKGKNIDINTVKKEIKEPTVVIPKEIIDLFGLKWNPFDRNSVKIKVEGQKELKTVELTDKQAAYVCHKGIEDFVKHLNLTVKEGEDILSKIKGYPKGSLFKVFNTSFEWYREYAAKLSEVGYKRVDENILDKYKTGKYDFTDQGIWGKYFNKNAEINIVDIDLNKTSFENMEPIEQNEVPDFSKVNKYLDGAKNRNGDPIERLNKNDILVSLDESKCFAPTIFSYAKYLEKEIGIWKRECETAYDKLNKLSIYIDPDKKNIYNSFLSLIKREIKKQDNVYDHLEDILKEEYEKEKGNKKDKELPDFVKETEEIEFDI